MNRSLHWKQPARRDQFSHSVRDTTVPDELPIHQQKNLLDTSSPEAILQMQSQFGNRATMQLLRGQGVSFTPDSALMAKSQPATNQPEKQSPEVVPIEVRKKMATEALARKKMHLDFVKMKRKQEHVGEIIKKKLGMQARGGDLYGHWWTEVGDLDKSGTWNPTKSYGWWPETKVNIKQTLKGVPGQLNKGQNNDPHHGDNADTEFHPTMEVDDNADYDAVRAQIEGNIDAFAQGFTGTWNWRLGWGKNCHTFQQRLKKQLKLHHQTSKHWLRNPAVLAEQQADEAQAALDAENAERARAAMFPEPKATFVSPYMLRRFIETEDGKLREESGFTRNGETVGFTGRYQTYQGADYIQYKYKDAWYWTNYTEEWAQGLNAQGIEVPPRTQEEQPV